MAQPAAVQPPARTLIVSLDFGTHSSGFAYAPLSGGEARLCVAWPHQPTPAPKTRTALLYEGRKVASWGWSARPQYSTAAGAVDSNLQYVDRFKLALAEGSPFTLPHGLSDVQTAADYLGEMRRFIMAHLRTALGAAAVHPDRIQWCLTVPAMWTDAGKHKMRQAALRAGIISKLSSDALLLILEPEAAALHASRAGSESVAAGDIFMVVDAGGGTVDVTLHRVVERAGQALLGQALLVEAAVGAGGLCGSTLVDERWEAHCRTVVGAEAYDAWLQQHPQERLWVQAKWEAVKCAFDYDGLCGVVGSRRPRGVSAKAAAAEAAAAAEQSVPIPPGMRHLMTEGALTVLGKVQRGMDDRVLLAPAAMQQLFDPVVDQVLALASHQLQRGRDAGHVCTKVLLVGGFAESSYLQRRLRGALGNAMPLVVPPSPRAAVLQGAILFGRQPGLIGSRCSRLSYGVNDARPSTPVHQAALGYTTRRQYVEEECCWYTTGLFKKFVGQVLGVDESVTHHFFPITSTQTTVEIDVYATDDNVAGYVKDAGMHKLGHVSVPLPEGWSKKTPKHLYSIKVTMHFGLTELKVEARNPRTNTVLDTSVVFAQTKLGAV